MQRHALCRHCTSDVRLSTNPGPFGDGMIAASPIADHIRRPNGSVKPAIGFHAAVGSDATPSDRMPFHGKSLSFAVRMKIGESRPAIESKPMFSMPAE